MTLRGPSPATTLVGTCTTDASGNCCIPISGAGTYSYDVVKARYVTGTGSTVISTFTTTTTVALTIPSGYVCCLSHPVPTSGLFATGPNGSCTLHYNGTGAGTWTGCYGYPASVRSSDPFTHFPPCANPFAGTAVTFLSFNCQDPPVLSKQVWGCDIVGGVTRGPGADQTCNSATGAVSSTGGVTSSDTGLGTGTFDPLNLSFTIGGPFDAGTFTVTE